MHTAELADAGQDTVQLSENQDRSSDTRGPPTGGRFQIRQDLIESFPEVWYDMIPVQADPVSYVESRSRPTDQHRALH
ncbi:MAG: hypothetical protein DMF53_14460 [Acidobacteria bacterium]|nr:MAG: hypothetical protein DMF53_14460 [Acidobacteriota bacterium]